MALKGKDLLREKVILVTGASGFIGQHLCRTLLDQAGAIHAVSRSKPDLSDTGLCWHKVDLADTDATRTAISKIRADFVFHLCSYAQGERDLALVLPTFRSELQAAVNVLTSVTEIGCERLIMAGSFEEPAPGDVPSSPYAAAKAATAAYARMFHRLYGLPVVMTRILMTYGPGQSTKKIIPHVISRMLRGEPVKIASPARKVDWIYVDDVVTGLLAAAIAPGLEGKSIDLGSGEFVQISDVVHRIQRLVKSSSVIELGAVPARLFEEECLADTATAHDLTRWRSSISFDEGLARTVSYYARSGGLGMGGGITTPHGDKRLTF